MSATLSACEPSNASWIAYSESALRREMNCSEYEAYAISIPAVNRPSITSDAPIARAPSLPTDSRTPPQDA
ncbi:hypothetical protein G6F63_016719 [Rhizopus arrhizus]|nr:hypothetical protein G6F31_021634 [Rhizopus arrhizus]KAG1078765.1 hypothetical protein G6F40_016582 [Rhizopus arrhizus]KAG1302736.1 hypothetical protein G6F63_016719 [Rhizopus arrhizus]